MGAQPFLSPYIYLTVLGLPADEFDLSLAQPYLSPFSSPAVLGEALQDFHAPPSPPRLVLLLDGVFLNLSLSPCWIKAWETSLGCTCVERGGAVRLALGSPVIWIMTSTTPSTRSLERFRIAIYKGM